MNKTYLIAFLTILRKETMRFLRIWPQTLLPPVITVTLYFTIFGHVLGPRIGVVNQIPYMQYIAPGLIMMSVVTNSYMNVVGSFYGLRFSKSVEELVIAPIPNYLILLGFTAGGIARGLIVGLLVTIIALFFTNLHIYNLLITISVIFLAAILFSLAGFTNALFAKKFDDTAIIPTFILTPLNYLGGIFYPIHLLPPMWYQLSLVNPIVYLVNAFRYGIIGISDISVIIAFIILISCSAALFIYNLYLLNKGKGIRT